MVALRDRRRPVSGRESEIKHENLTEGSAMRLSDAALVREDTMVRLEAAEGLDRSGLENLSLHGLVRLWSKVFDQAIVHPGVE